MDSGNDNLLAIPLARLERIMSDGHEQLMVAEELIVHILKDKVFRPWLFSTLCDAYSANYKLVSEVDDIIENCHIDKENEDAIKWKAVMSHEDIMILETIMVARYYTEREILQKGNLSLSIH